MKALKLSTLAACLLLFAVSCTKSSDTLSSSSATSSQNSVLGAKAGGITEQGKPEDKPGNGTTDPGSGGSQGNDKKPELVPSKSAEKVVEGDAVSITYTAIDASDPNNPTKPVECGSIIIYQWLNNTWTAVKTGNAPAVTFNLQTSTYGTCAYKFKAEFVPGDEFGATPCRGTYAGVGMGQQQEYCVNVDERPCVQTFEVKGSVTPKDNGDGTFNFTIKYTLTSPVDVTGVKFQGGATAGGQNVHNMIDFGNTTLVNANNQNTVLKWVGDLKACQPQEVTFTYKRNFSCPATNALVTGDWSASAGGTELGTIAKLPFSCQ